MILRRMSRSLEKAMVKSLTFALVIGKNVLFYQLQLMRVL